MRLTQAGLLAVAALSSTVSCFQGTHPLLAFASGAACDLTERLHLSIPGLHADDVSSLQSSASSSSSNDGLQKTFSAAQQKVYRPYVHASENLVQHLQDFLCAGQQAEADSLERYVELDDLSGLVGQERKERLQALGQDIASRCHGLPVNHLVTLSSHPQARSIHTKRQMIAPDMQEIEDALERITDAAQQQDASDIDKSQAQDWDLDDYLASEQASPAIDYQQQQPSGSARPTALPKNAALVEKYAIVSPNLVFAIGLFLIVFLPLGIYSVQALAAIEAPFGLESKMTGSVMSGDKKDQ